MLVLALLLVGCNRPKPSHALVVRNLESKCALIYFAGCEAFAQEASAHARHARHARHDMDAGSDSDTDDSGTPDPTLQTARTTTLTKSAL
jgi:hypothetical protein